MARRTNRFDEVQRYVAGIDLAGHADHYVCGPRKDDGTHDIEHFGTTTNEILRMVAWLKERKVVSVAMESTSVYWIYVYDMLEKAGIRCLLVDTRTVKMVPGRKSDVKDCQWLQKLHSCGLLRGAFRPPEEFNAVRSVIRESENVRQMRTQSIQSIQKSLDQMNVRVHHAVSDIDGVTGMRILAAIVGGERDPRVLAKLRDKRCRKSEAEIGELAGGASVQPEAGVRYAVLPGRAHCGLRPSGQGHVREDCREVPARRAASWRDGAEETEGQG